MNIATEAGLTGDEIQSIVDANMNKNVAQKAVQFVQPAKKDSNATISLGSDDTLVIPSDVIQNAPLVSTLEPPETKEESHNDVELYVYASDQDSRHRGWAGIAPELFERRVKFELDEDIDPFKLHNAGKKIKANITLIQKYDKERRAYRAERIVIHQISN